MTTKERFIYMIIGVVLGVTILLIGMAVSPAAAHREDAFDNIICKDLKLVDEHGNVVVWLYASSGGGIEIFNKKSPVVEITGTDHDYLHGTQRRGGNISLYSYAGSDTAQAHWNAADFSLFNEPLDGSAIHLSNDRVLGASVSVSYRTENSESDVTMYAAKDQNSYLSITNRHGHRVIEK